MSALATGMGFSPVQVAMAQNAFDTIGITRSETRASSQINGNPLKYSFPAEEMPPSNSVGPAPNDATDDVPLRMPDTSGTKANLAAFKGQVITLRTQDQKAYSKIHFFGTTTDGGPAGGAFTLRYSDNTTQSITVAFRDWCNTAAGDATQHFAIGPLSQRYRETGSDTARCGIYHVPGTTTAGKTLVSVTLPATTSPGNPPIQAYLMALTLEESTGAFVTPDISGTVAFPDDHTPPVSTSAINPTAPNGADGWYTSTPRITLTAVDEAGGSGVGQRNWRTDGGTVQVYGSAFNYSVEGDHLFEYRAVDGAGNIEGFKSFRIKLDTKAPVTAATSQPDQAAATGWSDRAVTIALRANDGLGSGANGTEYRVDGGAWTAYTAPFEVGDTGAHNVEYRSSDVAGNVEAPVSLRVVVDRVAPETSVRINGAPPAEAYTGSVRVAFTRDDNDGSGAVATEYRIGDGAWTPYTDAFDIDGNSGHRVDYRSIDLAGNVENFKSVVFVINPRGVVVLPFPDALPAPALPPVKLAKMDAVKASLSTLSALRGGKLAVGVTCQGVNAGTLTLTVSSAVAKTLHLKSRTLAKRALKCGATGRATVTLKPSAKVKRALARAKGSVKATLTLNVTGAAKTTQIVKFKGKKS